MSNPAEECYLLNHTLYGVVQREGEKQPDYDPMEEAEARWEFENGR